MKKTGRNDPCPCGSGKRYKQCCGSIRDETASGQNGFSRVAAPISGHHSSALPSQPTNAEISQLGALFNAGRHAELENQARLLIERNPDSGFAWKVLSTALQMQGKDALPAAQKAADLLPDDAQAHSNLGAALQALGQLDNAAASYRRALEIKPDFADAHYNLGLVLKDIGQPDAALASYRRALEIKPDYAEAHNSLGAALQDLGQLDAALSSFRRALEIKPDFAEVHSNLGNTLKAQGRRSEAAASFCRALELKPDYAEVLVAMGNMDVDEGRFAEAEAYFRRALEIEPKMPDAWAPLTNTRKMTPEDVDWLATAEEIVSAEIPPHKESSLRYAMGKFCDDVKDFDRAFQNYQRANELKKLFGKVYDRQQREEAVGRLIRDYPPEQVRRVRAGASDSARPLFIVGMPRSGTSLIEQIIASHSATFGAGELLFWTEAARRLEPTATPADMDDALLQKLAEDCLNNLAGFSADALRVVDKMPYNFTLVGLIHTVFPNARILHAQRNPVDTCLSIYFQNFNTGHTYANDLNDLAHYYKEYHRLMAHWRTVLPPEVFMDVPYEALVEDQEEWSRKIIEFIGLDWSERCMSFHETERVVGTASNWQVRQKIYKSSKERWRNYEKHVGPLLELLELYPSAIAQ